MNTGAAREKVRVAHALAELPLITAAFREGRISYSKVRAMTRVATRENEDFLLSIARHGTANHVERLVSLYRRTKRNEALELDNRAHALRELSWYTDDDGMWVFKGRFSAEQGALISKALVKERNRSSRRPDAFPRELYKSLTWDRGSEMADHKRFSLATDIKVYFCDPRSPWQRGSNENTNGLLRQYFPKGVDLSNIHQNRLNAVARQLNERPRKTLGFRTPAERFNQCVALTG